MTPYLMSNNGQFILYDGTILQVDSVQYSHNGITDWEDPPFRNTEHNRNDGNPGLLPAHKYRRVRLAGQTEFQVPEYIVAEDGIPVIIVSNTTGLYWKYINENDSELRLIATKSELKGETGEQGVAGQGLNINCTGAFDTRPACSNCGTGTCNSTPSCNCGRFDGGCGCNSGLYLYMSVGNHILNDLDDTGTFFTESTTMATTWVAYDANIHRGRSVVGWKGTDDTGLNGFTVVGNYIVVRTGVTTADNTLGKIYACTSGIWIQLPLLQDTYMVKESTLSNHIGYMDSYTSSDPATTNNIALFTGKLGVTNEGILVQHIADEVIGDGLEKTTDIHVKADLGIEVSGDGVKAKVELPLEVTSDGIGVQDNAIQGTKLHVNVADGSTIELNDNQLRVKPLGITDNEINDVAFDKITMPGADYGDILYYDAYSSKWTKLSIGLLNQHLTVKGNGYAGTLIPAWSNITPYTAGNGIDITNYVITNTKPDLPVTISGADGIGVTGTYPNFTIHGANTPEPYWGTLEKANDDATTIQEAIEEWHDETKMPRNVLLDNVLLVSSPGNVLVDTGVTQAFVSQGLYITPDQNKWFKLNVDANGNLITILL